MIQKVTRQFRSRKTLERKNIQSKGDHPRKTTQITKEAFITYEGQFHIEIDGSDSF